MSKVQSEMRSLLGHPPDWIKAIQKCDQDGDNRINWEEFWTAAYDRAKVINSQNLRNVFDMLDDNKDGMIDKAELSRCIVESNFGNVSDVMMSEDEWQRLIEGCDTDNDGKISYDEFYNYLTRKLTEQMNKTSRISFENDEEAKEDSADEPMATVELARAAE